MKKQQLLNEKEKLEKELYEIEKKLKDFSYVNCVSKRIKDILCWGYKEPEYIVLNEKNYELIEEFSRTITKRDYSNLPDCKPGQILEINCPIFARSPKVTIKKELCATFQGVKIITSSNLDDDFIIAYS
jgi:hypothetical protein